MESINRESRGSVSVVVRAPSNIALIKYMGKKEDSSDAGNLPENPSLSLTLNSLCTWAEVIRRPTDDPESASIAWVPEPPAMTLLPVPTLGEEGITRVISHVERVRDMAVGLLARHGLGCAPRGDLLFKTANTFPQSSGIASSASSFAAITLGTFMACAENPVAFEEKWKTDLKLRREVAACSREGSGSSCRSFEGPWVAWECGEGASAEGVPNVDMPPLAHFVLLVSEASKEISSSDAHKKVKTSPLWQGRVERATRRFGALKEALCKGGGLRDISNLAWEEAWEMHSLFHTSREPFTYWEPGTLKILKLLGALRKKAAGGAVSAGLPFVVTMDAGPNVHVIVEASENKLWRSQFAEILPEFRFLEDEPGAGATIVRIGNR